jgi:hypothetical protein
MRPKPFDVPVMNQILGAGAIRNSSSAGWQNGDFDAGRSPAVRPMDQLQNAKP